jgi:hypothetical protein
LFDVPAQAIPFDDPQRRRDIIDLAPLAPPIQ